MPDIQDLCKAMKLFLATIAFILQNFGGGHPWTIRVFGICMIIIRLCDRDLSQQITRGFLNNHISRPLELVFYPESAKQMEEYGREVLEILFTGVLEAIPVIVSFFSGDL